MPIPEAQLETWSKQGSVTQSRNTYATVKVALEASGAPYAGKNYGPYMQAIPINPLTGGSTVKDGTGAAAVAGADFIYDKTGGTGRIYGTSENVNGTKYVE